MKIEYKMAPSILAADFSKLGEEIGRLDDNNADYVHIDVMDGAFVPNISIGIPVVRSLRKCTELFFDVHLMVNEPIRYIEKFAEAGADGITVHAEACEDLSATLDKIIEMGGRNVVTLEDPIEIVKEHCLQIEMNESLGIDYYNSLKQILRPDPDVIMIGDIRDEKTAKVAITCALTGHLVLSTIHASNSLLVIKRMLNLGINETDLEDVLIGVVTQRIKYDRRNRRVIILPEIMNKTQIKQYFVDHTVSYPSFKDNALMLIKEKHCDQYLFKDELNGQ